MSTEGIVEFGKRIFDDYYSKKISLGSLMQLIDKRGASSNDYAVLGCYCEKDVKVTFHLHKLENRKTSKQYHKDFVEEPHTVKFVSMIMMTELENSAIQLDRHFANSKYRFAEMVVKEYRKSWGKDYLKLFNEIKERVEHFNFPSWNHIFKTYVLSY